MNQSPNIDPTTCRTCGQCCRWYSMGYDKQILLNRRLTQQQREENLTVFSELQRYLELQTDKVYIIEYETEFSVILDYPCKNLDYQGGIYTCKTYNSGRPLMCVRYPYRLNGCERYDKVINTFRDSKDFLQRIKELRGD
jgi:Fe-S-cluster containining protein